MGQIQESNFCKSSLKISCIVVGCLNALISCMLFLLMSYVTFIFEMVHVIFRGNGPGEMTDPILIVLFVTVLTLLMKFLLDILLIVAVVKKRPVIIMAYFIISLAFCLLLTAIAVYISIEIKGSRISIMELLYCLFDLVTIILSYFYYKELKRKASDDV